jgi:regulator of replication initiation timing
MERLNTVVNSKIEENQRLAAQNEELRRKLVDFT